jgi:GNAT superfamily N-acetyltransferase
MENRFRGRLHRDKISFTLVGELGGKPVATSTVVSCDLPARKDLRPWLAAVYVDPAHRRKGYGAALVRAACDHAAALGNDHLYLYTESAPGFYETLGWTTLEKRTYHGDEVTVMAYDVRSSATRERNS